METTLYDKNGCPTAYLAEDKETIYLWDGKAAAYVVDEKIYGFNGRHIGWYKNGVLYDCNGAKIGFRGDKCPSARNTSPIKCIKQVKHVKSERRVSRIRPVFKVGSSDEAFGGFLAKGL
jgi:hypothetical protein